MLLVLLSHALKRKETILSSGGNYVYYMTAVKIDSLND